MRVDLNKIASVVLVLFFGVNYCEMCKVMVQDYIGFLANPCALFCSVLAADCDTE